MTVGCTVENQDRADFRLTLLNTLPIKHKNIICQPLIEEIDIEKYLNDIELVVVGGESDRNARPLNYNWVLAIREQCIKREFILSLDNVGHDLSKIIRNLHLMLESCVVKQKKQTLIANLHLRD